MRFKIELIGEKAELLTALPLGPSTPCRVAPREPRLAPGRGLHPRDCPASSGRSGSIPPTDKLRAGRGRYEDPARRQSRARAEGASLRRRTAPPGGPVAGRG